MQRSIAVGRIHTLPTVHVMYQVSNHQLPHVLLGEHPIVCRVAYHEVYQQEITICVPVCFYSLSSTQPPHSGCQWRPSCFPEHAITLHPALYSLQAWDVPSMSAPYANTFSKSAWLLCRFVHDSLCGEQHQENPLMTMWLCSKEDMFAKS